MKAKLTFWEKWRVFWAKPYLLNIRSGEIHFIPAKTKHCWLSQMNPENKKYLSAKEFHKVLKEGYKNKPVNGCKWCNKAHDNG